MMLSFLIQIFFIFIHILPYSFANRTEYTSSQQLSTNVSNTDKYSEFSTTSLPILKFIHGNGLLFDYPVEIGQDRQLVGLRLDVVQGDVWIPADDSFTACSASSINQITTTLSDYSNFLIPTASSTSTATALTVNMADSVFVQSCASLGVFNIFESISSNFYNIYDELVVSLVDATSYLKTYMTGILVSGVWAVDNFVMSFRYNNKLVTLEFMEVPFVYSNFSSVGVGSLALGSSQSDYSYKKNFISNFVINNIIKTNSYSLLLNHESDSSARLLLGGINKNNIGKALNSNYEIVTEMALFDFVPVLDKTKQVISQNDGLSTSIPAFPIFGWGVSSNATGQSITFSNSYNDRTCISTYPKPAVIDSRYYYNFIPYSTLVEMAVELNAVYSSDLDRWLVDCSVGNSGTINLLLGNYTIHIPISKFLYPTSFNQTALVFENGDDACNLAFLPDYRIGYSLMGTPLLKSIYLAIDNENQQLAMSQLKNQLEDSNIVITNLQEKSRNNDFNKSREEKNDEDEDEDDTLLVKRAVTAGSMITPSSRTHGFSTLTNSVVSLTLELTSEITISSSIYVTTVTYSDNQLVTDITESNNLYAIESGTIPYATKYTEISSLTLTIPESIVLTDTINQSTEVFISNGEIYLQTTEGIPTVGGTTRTYSMATETSSIYGFTSLVSTLRTSKMVGAGSNLRVPGIINLQSLNSFNNSIMSFQVFLYLLIMTIILTVLL